MTSQKFTVVLERELCTGHARCMDACPEVFGADELGHCKILLDEVPDVLRAKAEHAVSNCPEGALHIKVLGDE